MHSIDSPYLQSADTFPYASNSVRFMRAPPLQVGHRFAVFGVPWDGAVTNRPGARFGPQEIRRASLMLSDGWHAHWGVCPSAAIGDAGDVHLSNASGIAPALAQIEQAVAGIWGHHHPVFLGGDHSITLALLRAAAKHHGKLAVLHFDAHCDTWQNHYGNEPSGHGTWVYEAAVADLIDLQKMVQVGIRSAAEPVVANWVADQGGYIATARSLRGLDGAGLNGVIGDIAARLQGAPCYLTLDIDCLDPAFAPGTGTPEPGGLSNSQLLTILEGLAPRSELNFVAMDCCEVAPAYDHAELTSMNAAHCVWTYIAGRMAMQG